MFACRSEVASSRKCTSAGCWGLVGWVVVCAVATNPDGAAVSIFDFNDYNLSTKTTAPAAPVIPVFDSLMGQVVSLQGREASKPIKFAEGLQNGVGAVGLCQPSPGVARHSRICKAGRGHEAGRIGNIWRIRA